MDIVNKTTRREVCPYNGFIIILETHLFENRFQRSESKHYELCMPDATTEKPWGRAKNRLCTWARTLEEIKELADKIVSGEVKGTYTDADRKKYISDYNSKHGWGFSKDMLLQTMRMHQKGDEKMKRLMEDRLEDANFHGYCGDLCNNDYEKFMERLEMEYRPDNDLYNFLFGYNLTEVKPFKENEIIYVSYGRDKENPTNWALTKFRGINIDRMDSRIVYENRRVAGNAGFAMFAVRVEDFDVYNMDKTLKNVIVSIGNRFYKGISVDNSNLIGKLNREFLKGNK